MKNKMTLSILVPLVAIIWGLIIWKVIDFNHEETIVSPSRLLISEAAEVDNSRYELTINYRDPFLRSAQHASVTTSSLPAKSENNIKKVDLKSMAEPVRPANLVYRGVISCKEDRIGLLEIGEQNRLIKENNLIGEYEIISLGNDSLRIGYQEKEFTYVKQ